MPRKSDLFVDTSGWGCYIAQQDPRHTDVKRIMQGAVKQKRRLVTTNYVIAELVPLLSRYHIPWPTIIKAVNGMKSDPNVEIVHIDSATDDEA